MPCSVPRQVLAPHPLTGAVVRAEGPQGEVGGPASGRGSLPCVLPCVLPASPPPADGGFLACAGNEALVCLRRPRPGPSASKVSVAPGSWQQADAVAATQSSRTALTTGPPGRTLAVSGLRCLQPPYPPSPRLQRAPLAAGAGPPQSCLRGPRPRATPVPRPCHARATPEARLRRCAAVPSEAARSQPPPGFSVGPGASSLLEAGDPCARLPRGSPRVRALPPGAGCGLRLPGQQPHPVSTLLPSRPPGVCHVPASEPLQGRCPAPPCPIPFSLASLCSGTPPPAPLQAPLFPALGPGRGGH